MPVSSRDRESHGQSVRSQLQTIMQQYEGERARAMATNLVREDVIYVEFESPIDFQLKSDSLEDGQKGKYFLLNTKEIPAPNQGKQYRTTVMLRKDGISKLLKKVEDYLNPAKDSAGGNAKNQPLINNIESIRQAALAAFWDETLDGPFPDGDEPIWWEIWLRRSNFTKDAQEDQKVVDQLGRLESDPRPMISRRRLLFPETIIRLVKATPQQLAEALLRLDNLSLLRKPQEMAGLVMELPQEEEAELVENFLQRIDDQTSDESLTITVLDTGVNNGHPLIQPFLPDTNLDTLNPAWDTADADGHGTGMAGLALYGDLTPLLASNERVSIRHRLESVKTILDRNGTEPHAPELFGAVTEEAVARAVVLGPDRIRLYCKSITGEPTVNGRPSSYSSAVDKIAFGREGGKQLIILSAGNTGLSSAEDYPEHNLRANVHDPNQAFNALSVGAYTQKVIPEQDPAYPQTQAIAPAGGLSPFSTTTNEWDSQWPNKPDIVMEGGNQGYEPGDLIRVDSLHLLTSARQFQTRRMLQLFNATSAATALASRLAAQLWLEYPAFWPETIRGLLVHSAQWSQEMLEHRPVWNLNQEAKRRLLRTYGYGIPDLQRARDSASNSLTLIVQRTIQPFHKVGSEYKTKDMHLHRLPWPEEVLSELGSTRVRLNVTLSYFIEPNPNEKPYSSKFVYQSHGLRFRMKRPTENETEFRERINRAARDPEEESISRSGESWLIKKSIRDKGSIHRDIWEGSAADLATKNLIAVHPVNGWYRTRIPLKRYDDTVRYALIISIEAPEIDLDLYNLIAQELEIPLSAS